METLIGLGQVLILIVFSPLFQGFIKKFKALSQGRKGPGILQPYYDVMRLFRKDMAIARSASWIFHATPYIVFVSTVTAASFVPVLMSRGGVLAFGDVVVIIYTLALAKFFTALAGMDTGTAFGGEGSSREMTVGLMVEPILMLAVFTTAVALGTMNLAGMVQYDRAVLSPAHLMAFAAFYVAIIAETGRVPVDNPDTHLELTMIHEGMILEYSGRYLALIEWAHWIKQMLLLTLAVDLFFPIGIAEETDGLGISVAAYAVKMIILGAALALTESSRVKMRFFKLTGFLGGAFILALLALITFIMTGR
jgi:formate hydrogenlyase subunit 4